MKNAPTPRKPSAACFEPSEASETFSGAFLSFPRPRKRSAARFDTFRRVGNVQRRVLTLSEASGASADGLCRGWEAGEVPGQIRRRPQTPAPTVVRAFGSLRVSGQLPCPGRGRPQTPGLFYVLIGISVRLHLAFASGFLSVCEGKGLYVRRACQYVILRISSRPCTWPECSFYRRPIYCLSAPYASHGVPEIREP